MAKASSESLSFETLKKEILDGNFRCLYVLSGDEAYFPEELCRLIIEHAMNPADRDFNQLILYGSDVSAETIVSYCQEYPMFSVSNRKLIVVKDAQSIRRTEALEKYTENMSRTTVLVLLYSGKTMDKRTSFYKKASAAGAVFESGKVELDRMPGWIDGYVRSVGMSITPDASQLLAESAGTSLRKVVMEIDKMRKNLSEETSVIEVGDVEKNVGVSREFSTMELTSALSARDAKRAFKIAWYFGRSPKQYPIQMTLGWLFYFFSKVEAIHAAAMSQNTSRPDLSAAATKAGIFYRYAQPYIAAARSFSLMKTMKIISLLRECDYKSKSNERGEASDGELLTELIARILN
ncbi:MAG: DNA polymerase III subunit delta [Alistipes sp.]|nr:DNA polymerase III subunit delta [Candidatus Minthomonas equi]